MKLCTDDAFKVFWFQTCEFPNDLAITEVNLTPSVLASATALDLGSLRGLPFPLMVFASTKHGLSDLEGLFCFNERLDRVHTVPFGSCNLYEFHGINVI